MTITVFMQYFIYMYPSFGKQEMESQWKTYKHLPTGVHDNKILITSISELTDFFSDSGTHFLIIRIHKTSIMQTVRQKKVLHN
jgi:hypothetical protein